MSDAKNIGAINRKQKFAPDPAQPLDVAMEQIKQLSNEVKLLRQNMQVTTLHTFDRSVYIDPTQGEVLWDFQWQRGYIWHHEKWRPLAPPTYHIKVFPDNQPVLTTTGEDRFYFNVSADMDEMYLYDVRIYVSTAGDCEVQLDNTTQGHNMLSTPATIDGGELSSNTAATPPVIDPVNSQVFDDDLIAVQVDAAGGCKGLGIQLVFNPFIDIP